MVVPNCSDGLVLLPVTSTNGSLSIRTFDVLNVIRDTPLDVMDTALAGKKIPVVELASVVMMGDVAVPLEDIRNVLDTNTVELVILNRLTEPVLNDMFPPLVDGLNIPLAVSDANVSEGVLADPLDKYFVDE